MSYLDRLRNFVYTSPSGQEFTLNFDSLSRTGGKKAPVTEFPGQNQGAVQDLGNITPTFPVSCYISGADYDLEADRFWEALHESGPGRLDHPRYGNLSVLPIPETQSEEFVDGAGRAVFTITFIRADEKQFEYPSVTIDYATQVSANVDSIGTEIASAVPDEITDTKTLSGLTATIQSVTDTVSTAFDQITGITDDIQQQINQTIRDIENNIDALVAAPDDLMESVLELYRLPATLEIDIQEKLNGYKGIYTNLADSLVTQTETYGVQFGTVMVAILCALVGADMEASSYGDTPTRTQAGEIIEDDDEFASDIRESIEDIEAAGGFVAEYQLLLQVEKTITETISGLIDTALDLPTERTEVLDREVTPIQFVYEKYGDLEQLDFFIAYNNLCCNDIILMPRGLEVRYYFE